MATSAARHARSRSPSTARRPAYRAVLELHGWGELQGELNALSKQGKWKEMGELIDDDMLDTFAVVAEPDAARRPGCSSATRRRSTGSASTRRPRPTPRPSTRCGTTLQAA